MSKALSEALKEIKEYKQNVLEGLYNQCKPEQQEFFRRMYKTVKNFPENKINWAIQQCERTVNKNKKEGEVNG